MLSRGRTRRALPALLAAPALLIAVPAVADAASVSRSSNIVTFTASAGEANNVAVKVSGTDLVVTDSGVAALTDGDGDGGCTVSGRIARCALAGLSSVRVYTNDGNDIAVASGPQRVSLSGGDGNDQLTGGDGADTVLGEAGNDLLAGGRGADAMRGGDGTDRVRYGSSTENEVVTLDGQPNDGSADDGGEGARDNVATDVENLSGGQGADTLTGDANANELLGGPGNDTLDGAGGNDIVTGETGDDTLIGGKGADRNVGGTGTDVAGYTGSTEAKTIDLRVTGAKHGSDEDGPAGARDTINPDVEGAAGGSANDKLIGTGAANVLDGGPGNDVLNGAAGDDTLRGGPGTDELAGGLDGDAIEGGDGNDLVTYEGSKEAESVTPGEGSHDDGSADDGPDGDRDDVAGDVERIAGGTQNDWLIGTDAANTISGGDGDDFIYGGRGADVMRGGAGTDTVTYGGSQESKTITLDGVANDGSAEDGGAKDSIGADVENATGASGDDSITGNDGQNQLFGGPGGDVITGRGGNDIELGGEGRDVFFQDAASNGSDMINGQGGAEDLAYYISRTEPVVIDLTGGSRSGTDTDGDGVGNEADMIMGVEVGYGGSGNDRLKGDDGPNTFFGALGNDSLVGYGGDDHLMGNEGDDALNAGDGNDVVDGGYGADQLWGSRGDDQFPVTSCAVLCGDNNDRRDHIDGEEGTDTLDYQYRVVGVRVDVGSSDNGEDADFNGDTEEDDTVAGIERILGTNQRDWIRGTDGADEIDGRGGDDVLNGAGGGDAVRGGEGNDSVDGGAGADSQKGEAGDDNLFQGFAPDEGDDIQGGSGDDTADYSGRGTPVAIRLDDIPNDGADGELDNVRTDIERLKGGTGGDTLAGDSGVQRMWGGGGADQITGDGGADELHGGAGNDNLAGGEGGDRIDGDDDDDTLDGGEGNDELHGGNNQDRLDGGMGDDAMYGEVGDDWFEGGTVANGADLISCGTGGDSPETHPWYDTVAYFSGNITNGRTQPLYINPDGIANDGQDADATKGGEEGDNIMPDCEEIWGGKANDYFEGTTGQDRFIGMEGNDGFRSNGGPDFLEGRDGDDVFLAKDGQQQWLQGGPGTDVAQYDAGVDRLFDVP